MSGFVELTPAELSTKRSRGERFVLLDVREPWEVTIAHIEGSIHIPMGAIPSQHTELDPQQEIVVYCHHGIRSRNVCSMLVAFGFQNVKNLAGGIDAWSAAADPNVPRY